MIPTASLRLGTDARALGERFLAWWFGELRALVPAPVLRAIHPAPRRLVVELGPVFTLKLAAEGREQVLAQGVAGDHAALAAALADHGDLAGETGAVVLLPPEKVLRRRLTLPLTRDRDLRPLLAFELERQTPLAAAQVHYDVRVLSRDHARHRMTVEVAMARRETVDVAVAEIAACGMACASVGAVPVAGSSWLPSLLALAPQSPTARRRRLVLAGLAALIAVLAVTLVIVDEMRSASVTAAIQAELRDAKAAAQHARDSRAKAAALAEQRHFLPDLRRARLLSGPLDELAKILPDDTYLTGLNFDGDVIRIQGVSTKADRLIEIIDASHLFTDARFTAPLVQQPGSGADRFDITLKRRPPS
ncbi:MAG TPA: type II secretion system protein GspL [Stellaceae bacterium]|nr:type II secretion system protein GspL [Stellaceae bacterium]